MHAVRGVRHHGGSGGTAGAGGAARGLDLETSGGLVRRFRGFDLYNSLTNRDIAEPRNLMGFSPAGSCRSHGSRGGTLEREVDCRTETG